jgi:hypothetical protein
MTVLALLCLAVLPNQELTPNVLTDAERAAGWRLLFDGTLGPGASWRAYRGAQMPPGWAVKEGALVCVRPAPGNDIVTREQFAWFELKVSVKADPGQNSGIMFHVSEDGAAPWQSGPEIQIYDAALRPGVETTGCLYQLYRPDADAGRPAGEWQSLRLRVAPDRCWTELNGRRLYEFVLGSDDFNERVARSKFARYPGFGARGRGHIALQGDHGVVWFRDIKIRELDD